MLEIAVGLHKERYFIFNFAVEYSDKKEPGGNGVPPSVFVACSVSCSYYVLLSHRISIIARLTNVTTYFISFECVQLSITWANGC
jgi:hypothetical protein